MTNQPDSDKLRVLIVEDDEATSYALRTRLGREGIDADIAPNGFDAIQFVTERPYDAILLDLITPGPMNGFSVLSYLEAEHPEMVERLFITSGMPEQTIAHAAPQLLPRYYRKPYDIDVVIGAVAKAIRRVEPVADNTRVLIADDDGDIRLLVSTIARMLGRESVQAADGLDAIRQLASEQFAGAVVDLVMPNVDGFGVLRYLREENPEMLAKTVVLTGMPDRYRSRALLDDICALIEKPTTPEKIRAALAQCLALPETA